MRRITVRWFAVLALLLMAADDPPARPSIPQPPVSSGGKVSLRLDYTGAVAPGFESERTYRAFLLAVRSESADAIVKSVSKAAVIPINSDLTMASYREGTDYPLFNPAIEVNVHSGLYAGQTFFMPAQYFRKPEDPGLKLEHMLPAFAIRREPDYEAEVGDTVLLSLRLTYNDVPVAKGMTNYEEFLTALKANDSYGIKELVKQKRVGYTPSVTPMLVIKRRENPFIGDGVPVIEGRLLDGPYRNETVWVPEMLTVRRYMLVVKNPGAAGAKKLGKPKATLKGGKPAALASMAYRDARKLEGEGRFDAATKAYRAIVETYATFPEAKLATQRLKVLTGK